MKIAVFHNLPPGGAKRTVYEQMKYLSKKHLLDLYEYSSTDESLWDVRKFAKNIYLYEFHLERKSNSFLGRLDKDYRNFITLKNLNKNIAQDINKKNYDVCLIHADCITQAPYILRFLTIPSLYFCQEYLRLVYEEHFKFERDVVWPKKFYENAIRLIRKRIDRKNAQSAVKILANSNFTKTNIDKAFGVESTACHLGVDINIFKKRLKNRGNFLLYIGEKNKTGDVLLLERAVKSLPKNCRPQIKRLGSFKGKLKVTDDEVLAKEYSKAIATVCTSYNEPFGLAPIESMACETPVLAVNEGGHKETVIDGKTGYLLPRDAKVFASKIKFLIKNPNVAREMGKYGRKHVTKSFTWEKHSKSIEKHLTKL